MKFFSSLSSSEGMKGVTLVEVVVTIGVFSIVSLAIYNAYQSTNGLVRHARKKVDGIALANEQLEIARNLPYTDVGISGGLPSGKLLHVQTLTRDTVAYTLTTTVRNIDDPFDGTIGGTPNDTSPADYKLVDIHVACAYCNDFAPFSLSTRVAPKNLELSNGNGALFVRVFDANGQPVSGATVHIENTKITPNITVDDVTNAAGMLTLVDTPPGINAYHVTVSKEGYSSDQSYPPGASPNPNPTTPDATVVAGGVTQLSFGIDRVSTLNIQTVTATCAPVDSVAFQLDGSKQIGSVPTVLKYSQPWTTDAGGKRTLLNMEWDTYTPRLTSTSYDLFGAIPPLPFTLSPNTMADLQLVVTPKQSPALVVNVKDATTSLPLSDATVLLQGPQTITQQTGQGFLRQTDWSGGPGQSIFTNTTQFFASDGNMNTSGTPGELSLRSGATTGQLESSTFDTGGDSTFHQLLWQPQDQPLAVGPDSVQFHIATNSDGTTWNYTGPDGTASTYYTLANQTIASSQAAGRYLRYKVFLSSVTPGITPNISDIAVTVTTSCTPPGQVFFASLSSGTYTRTVSKPGYQPTTATVSVSGATPWQQQDVTLSPS